MTTTERYALVSGEVPDIMCAASPVDPDNGNAAPYRLNMCTSDILGVLLALRSRGYVIRKSLL